MPHEDVIFPQTHKQAQQLGFNYFLSARECPIHHMRFHWAHTGACMSCRDYDGQPYLQKPKYDDISRIKRKPPPSG